MDVGRGKQSGSDLSQSARGAFRTWAPRRHSAEGPDESSQGSSEFGRNLQRDFLGDDPLGASRLAGLPTAEPLQDGANVRVLDPDVDGIAQPSCQFRAVTRPCGHSPPSASHKWSDHKRLAHRKAPAAKRSTSARPCCWLVGRGQAVASSARSLIGAAHQVGTTASARRR